MYNAEQQLLRGTVDLLILRALEEESNHGYGVARWIRERSGEELQVEDAALYQGLHRLARKGWVTASWGASENNRRAKFYQITAKGRRQLHNAIHTWRRYAAAVVKVVGRA